MKYKQNTIYCIKYQDIDSNYITKCEEDSESGIKGIRFRTDNYEWGYTTSFSFAECREATTEEIAWYYSEPKVPFTKSKCYYEIY